MVKMKRRKPIWRTKIRTQEWQSSKAYQIRETKWWKFTTKMQRKSESIYSIFVYTWRTIVVIAFDKPLVVLLLLCHYCCCCADQRVTYARLVLFVCNKFILWIWQLNGCECAGVRDARVCLLLETNLFRNIHKFKLNQLVGCSPIRGGFAERF